MIIRNGLRNGNRSASAIFRLARSEPVLAHTLRVAGRGWWKAETAKCGGEYTCVWFHTAPEGHDGPAPGWVVENNVHSFWTAMYVERAKTDGYEVHQIPLAWADDVFQKAAKMFGLGCRICPRLETTDSFDRFFLCAKCKGDASRLRCSPEQRITKLLARTIVAKVRADKRRHAA